MNHAQLATGFAASLPDWLIAELPELPTALPSDEDRMRYVNALADRNFREGNGGPFSAIVVDRETGNLVSVGVNVVLSSRLSSVHAEVMAISLAQAQLQLWDLGALDLQVVVNWRPCAMCYGALLWSGARSLLIAGDGPECEQFTGFDEGPVVADWREQLEARGIAVTEDVLRAEAIAVFKNFGDSNGIVYNARQ
jgi:tRNA(Arg) A34 adenosine deaminase TadA